MLNQSQPRFGRVAPPIAPVGLALVFIFLAGFSLWVAVTTRHAVKMVKITSHISDQYDHAQVAVGTEESAEWEYQIHPSPEVSEKHRRAAAQLVRILKSIRQDGGMQTVVSLRMPSKSIINTWWPSGIYL